MDSIKLMEEYWKIFIKIKLFTKIAFIVIILLPIKKRLDLMKRTEPTVVIGIRIKESDKKKILDNAKSVNMSLNDYVKAACLLGTNKTLVQELTEEKRRTKSQINLNVILLKIMFEQYGMNESKIKKLVLKEGEEVKQ